ncbi:hypothetical protein J437_LFUL016360 [Ladona fulva]|uniref:Spermidine synthase n=1 Tax=Ladona fulva TaxID=123851 RepID=A0A8K0KLC0_LADFU|nr:hypothetical protein J437_LFUL016360 [Ladona fulva]
MDALKKGWFSELCPLWPGMCLSLEVEEIIHSEKSKYQDIMVLKTKSHGRVLTLDGIIQCTEADEFSYQEMISFLPLCSHPCPKKVLIIGGGDGGVAREVAKHPDVETIIQCEIDERVVELSRKYLPFMASGFDNPKLTLHIGDGFEFMGKHQKEFDVIITDSSDPVGPAEALFEESYFRLMKAALRDGGIICSQAENIWAGSGLDIASRVYKFCQTEFSSAAYGYCLVPTYPTGQIGFVLGGLNPKTNFKEPLRILSKEEQSQMDLRYYSPEIHRCAFVLPRFAKKVMDGEA